MDYGSFTCQTYRPYYFSRHNVVVSNRPLCKFHPTYRHTRSPGSAIVGNLIFFLCMGTRHHEEYLRLNKTYGDIFRLFFGNRMFITICGYDTICDAFVRQGSVLSDRPEGLFHPGPGYEKSGIDICITLAID